MRFKVIDSNVDTTELDNLIVGEDFTIKPASWFKQFTDDQIKLFMLKQAIYVLPTEELLDYLDEEIGDNFTIEIGSGRGFIGRELDIICTDNYCQQLPEVKAYYNLLGQAVINYPKHVMRMDANTAVNKLHPHTVIGCFVTHKWRHDTQDGNDYGIQFDKLLRKVKKLILVGNKEIHKNNPIMRWPHEELYFDWLITRAVNPELNRIFVWKEK